MGDSNSDNNNNCAPDEQLIQAAQDGDHLRLKELLLLKEGNINVNYKEKRRRDTALHKGCLWGYLEVVKILIENGGAKVNAKNKYGWTPLHIAYQNNRVAVAEYLMEHGGANVNAKNNAGMTPLHEASWGGHLDRTKFLVEHGADVNTKDNKGKTPLYCSSSNGHLDVAKFLIEYNGANDDDVVNAKTYHAGLTPLHGACGNGYFEVAKLLIFNMAATSMPPMVPERHHCTAHMCGIILR